MRDPDEERSEHLSTAELHSMNSWNMGPMECGCSKYNVEVMGCDHDCDDWCGPLDEPLKPTKEGA